MANPTDKNLPPGLHAPDVVPPKQSRRLNLVWLVPIIAALVGIGLAVKSVMDRGPEITLQLSSADGLEAGKTKIKYKDVEIGSVKTIVLSEDRKTVAVTAELVRQAAPMLVEDTRFWVVRPRVGLAGVSGLGTLLSGAYIGLDVGKSTSERRHYIGLEEPPVITSDRPGREFVLKAADLGSLDVNTPIYLRRVQVGRVISHSLDKDGLGVTVNVFVDSPYDKFINPTTRFFMTSGIDLTLDDKGFRLDTQSLSSIVMGGISFNTARRNAGLAQAAAKSEFTLYADEKTAMRVPDGLADSYIFTFNESVRGLRVGSTIDFRGVPVGEVTSIGVDVVEGHDEVVMVVEADIYRSRLARKMVQEHEVLTDVRLVRGRIDRMVKSGLRAQMRSGSLVTGENYIALDYFKGVKATQVDWTKPVPEFPTVPGKFVRLEEDLMKAVESLKTTMASADKLLRRLDGEVAPEVTQTLNDVQRTLGTADKLMASDAPVQQELRETLREVSKAASSLRNLTDMLERQPEALIKGKKGDEQ